MVTKWWLVAGSLAIALFFTAGVTLAKEEGTKTEPTAKVELPAPAAKAIADAWPKATIGKVWMHEREGLALYTADLKEGTVETKVVLDAAGNIETVAGTVDAKTLPEVVTKAITDGADGGTLKGVERREVRADLKKDGTTATLVKLDKPRVEFVASFTKDTKVGMLVLGDDGKVIHPVKWMEHKEKGGTGGDAVKGIEGK
jgi:hypothetical protein